MKIAILSDLHFGVRSDSPIVLNFQKKSFSDYIFPELETMDIDAVMIAGDLVDRRKYVNYHTAKQTREHFLEPLARSFGAQNVFIIPGNHDIYHKNTLSTNALDELLGGYGFNIYREPTPIQLSPSASFLMLPWICDANRQQSLEAVHNCSNMNYVLGHLELAGYEMYRGMYCEHGMDGKLFSRYRRVLTGHFHKPSQKDNINYLGAPYPMIWTDWDDDRGFNVFDTDTNELTFYRNPFELFHTLVYDDSGKELPELLNFDNEKYRDCYVKVIVERKTNDFFYEKFLERIEAVAYEAKKIEGRIVQLDAGTPLESCDDTLTVLRNTVKAAETEIDKTQLERFLLGLYTEAINSEA